MHVTYWTVPGLAGSDGGHWQTIWEKQYPHLFDRVEQKNWDWPVREEWTGQLQQYLAGGHAPIILIAHSLGCTTVAWWAKKYSSNRVLGAFLVAPADAEQSRRLSFVEGFRPIPTDPLPFPSMVIASTNDIYMSIERSEHFATLWGSEFVNIGNRGHINASSGLDDWKDGKALLNRFTAKITSSTSIIRLE